MVKCPAVTFTIGWVVSLLGRCRRPKFKVITLFRSITMFVGLTIFYIILSLPHNIVMDLNDVMLKWPPQTFTIRWVMSLSGYCRRPKLKVMTLFKSITMLCGTDNII